MKDEQRETVEASIVVGRSLSGVPAPAVDREVLEATIGHRVETAGDRYGAARPIATGGMGEVLMVEDRHLGRNVVMKRVLPDKDSPAHISRFVREARITAQLEHPSIVPVHELGEQDGKPYFTMKLVYGETLASLIGRLRTDSIQAAAWTTFRRLQLFRGLANALAFAHSKGVLHRDLKPSNVMVGEFGEVQLMDWGLARATGGRGEVQPSRRADLSDDTALGSIVGTPGYMSPEQARGQEVDQRADIYALGVVLLELLTGRNAFRRTTIALMLVDASEGNYIPIGSDELDKQLPPELTAILETALAADPDDRYSSVELLCADIDAFMAGHAVSVHRDSLLRRGLKWVRRNKAAAAAIVALTLGLAGADAWHNLEQGRRLGAILAEARGQVGDGAPLRALTTLARADGVVADHPDIERLRLEITNRQLAELRERRRDLGPGPASADAETRYAWYEGQSSLYRRAGALARLARSPEPQRLERELARAMSRQLASDGSRMMSALMLEQAAAAGLEPAALASERAIQREAVEAARRESLARIRAQLHRATVEYGGLAHRQGNRRALEAITAEPPERVREALLPVAFREFNQTREIVFDALAATAGDGSLRVEVAVDRLPASGSPPTRIDQLGRWLALELWAYASRRWALQPEQVAPLRSDQLLCALALRDAVTPPPPPGLARRLRRLERLDTEASQLARAALAWTLGPTRESWRRLRANGSQRPLPGDLPPLLRGMVAHAHGRDEEARLAYQQAPHSAARELAAGWLALDRGQPELAQRAADGLLAEHPLAARRLLAWARLQSGGAAEARAQIAAVADLRPDQPHIRADQAAILTRSGQHQEALAVCRVMRTAQGSLTPALQLERARALLAARRPTEALAALQPLLQMADDDPAVQLELARAQRALGDHAAAYDTLETAIALDLRWLAPARELIDLLSRAPHRDKGRQLASHALREILRHPARERLLPELISEIALARRRVPGYLLHCRLPQLLEQVGQAIPGRAEAAIAIELARGRFDQALELLSALEGPPSARRWRLRAIALWGKARLDPAVAAIDAAIALTPGDAALHEDRGRLLARKGDGEGALAAFRRALELEPLRPHARWWQAQLKLAMRPPDASGAASDLLIAFAAPSEVVAGQHGLEVAASQLLGDEISDTLLEIAEVLIVLQPAHGAARMVRALRRQDNDPAGALRDLRAIQLEALPDPWRPSYQRLKAKLEGR